MWLGHVWQYGHKDEKILQSGVHRLPHLQQTGHVSHHAPLSTALLQIWWVPSAEQYNNKKCTLIPDIWDAGVTSFQLHQKTMQVDQHVLLVNNMDSGPALTSLNQHTSLSWSFQQEWLENYTEYAVYWEIYYIFIALPSLYIL